jgi:branched-chain amino acid transport system permease protein
MSAAVSSLPRRVHQNSVEHWVIRTLWAAAAVAFVLYIPMKSKDGTIGDMTFALQLAIAAMALNLVMGFGGIISIGHSAYFGVGAYTTAVLVDHYDWSQGWTIYIAAALGFVVGCATSLPALRLKGVYLALVTLGLAVLFPQLIKWQKAEWLTDGARGIDRIGYRDIPTWRVANLDIWPTMKIGPWTIVDELRRDAGRTVFMWWTTVIVLAIAYLVCRGVVKSRVGRSLVAIRDNETAAAVMGVNTARTKAIVFGVSASMCAAAGSLFAVSLSLVNPDLRYVTLVGSIIFLLVMVLGGAATLWGPIIGAIAYVLVETETREAAASGDGFIGWLFGWMSGSPAALILALVLLGMMYVAPFGIIGLLKRLAAKFVVIIPSPAGSGPPPTIEIAEAPSIDEPFQEITTGEIS